ncbi:MAG: ABC transporter ATP-binding protein [Lachnospiraceae bacterium]|nr:ABC transporter ATP-binding protein [Lachnospiraceae bacterium]
MNNAEVSEKLKNIEKELEFKRIERRELAEIYENEKKFVTICGISAVICILLHQTLLRWMVNSEKHASLKAVGMYFQPIVFMIFLILVVAAIAKGFDFFMNSRLRYAQQLSEKLKRKSLSDEIHNLSEEIIFLEEESGKLQEDMINKRAEKELAIGKENTEDSDKTAKSEIQDINVNETKDEWAALFEMDEEDDFEGSSDEMWKRDVLHM